MSTAMNTARRRVIAAGTRLSQTAAAAATGATARPAPTRPTPYWQQHIPGTGGIKPGKQDVEAYEQQYGDGTAFTSPTQGNQTSIGNNRNYGAWMNLPPGSRRTMDFVDRDGDRIDDRFQAGPGQKPSAATAAASATTPLPTQGNQTSAATASKYGEWINLPPGVKTDRRLMDSDGDGIDDRRQTGPGQKPRVRPPGTLGYANAFQPNADVPSMSQWAKTHGKILKDPTTGQILPKGSDPARDEVDGEIYKPGTMQPHNIFAHQPPNKKHTVYHNGVWYDPRNMPDSVKRAIAAGQGQTLPAPPTPNYPRGGGRQSGGSGQSAPVSVTPMPYWAGPGPAGTGGIKPTREAVQAYEQQNGSGWQQLPAGQKPPEALAAGARGQANPASPTPAAKANTNPLGRLVNRRRAANLMQGREA
jgi:hypothetical protein